MLLVLLVGIVAAVGWFLDTDTDTTAWDLPVLFLVLGIGIFGMRTGYKRLIDTTPQLTLDAWGIETVQYGFRSWKDISHERIHESPRQYFHLTYLYENQSETLPVDSYNLAPHQLASLLQAYRRQFEKASKPSDA